MCCKFSVSYKKKDPVVRADLAILKDLQIRTEWIVYTSLI